MYQQTVEKKPVSRAMKSKLQRFVAEAKAAAKGPAFRKAAKEFYKYPAGKELGISNKFL